MTMPNRLRRTEAERDEARRIARRERKARLEAEADLVSLIKHETDTWLKWLYARKENNELRARLEHIESMYNIAILELVSANACLEAQGRADKMYTPGTIAWTISSMEGAGGDDWPNAPITDDMRQRARDAREGHEEGDHE